jgi:hypothetical protein
MGSAFFAGMMGAGVLLVVVLALIFDAFVFHVPHEKSILVPILLSVMPSLVAAVGFDKMRIANPRSILLASSFVDRFYSFLIGLVLGLVLLPVSTLLLPWLRTSQLWGTIALGVLFLCGGMAGGYFYAPIRNRLRKRSEG